MNVLLFISQFVFKNYLRSSYLKSTTSAYRGPLQKSQPPQSPLTETSLNMSLLFAMIKSILFTVSRLCHVPKKNSSKRAPPMRGT